jgi:hypothetical protein
MYVMSVTQAWFGSFTVKLALQDVRRQDRRPAVHVARLPISVGAADPVLGA